MIYIAIHKLYSNKFLLEKVYKKQETVSCYAKLADVRATMHSDFEKMNCHLMAGTPLRGICAAREVVMSSRPQCWGRWCVGVANCRCNLVYSP